MALAAGAESGPDHATGTVRDAVLLISNFGRLARAADEIDPYAVIPGGLP
jgi:hypothetical protein